jgi:hypothetical protein
MAVDTLAPALRGHWSRSHHGTVDQRPTARRRPVPDIDGLEMKTRVDEILNSAEQVPRSGIFRTDFGESVKLGRRLPSLAEYYRGGLRLEAEPGTCSGTEITGLRR